MKRILVVLLTVLYLMSVQRLFFLVQRDIGVSYLLLHDMLLNDDSYRSGIAELECAVVERIMRLNTFCYNV